METASSSESCYQTTRHKIPSNYILHSNRQENLKSHILHVHFPRCYLVNIRDVGDKISSGVSTRVLYADGFAFSHRHVRLCTVRQTPKIRHEHPPVTQSVTRG